MREVNFGGEFEPEPKAVPGAWSKPSAEKRVWKALSKVRSLGGKNPLVRVSTRCECVCECVCVSGMATSIRKELHVLELSF